MHENQKKIIKTCVCSLAPCKRSSSLRWEQRNGGILSWGCWRRRGTSGWASHFNRISAPSYPFSSSLSGSLSNWSNWSLKCTEHRRLFFVGTKTSRRPKYVKVIFLTLSFGKLTKNLSPHPWTPVGAKHHNVPLSVIWLVIIGFLSIKRNPVKLMANSLFHTIFLEAAYDVTKHGG